MNIRFFIILLFALLSINLYAQSTHWQRYFSYTENDDGLDICTANDGNIYTAGFVSYANSYGWLLKLNPFGDTIWTRKIIQLESISAIEPTPDNGCIIAGRGTCILKVNSDGDTVWSIPITAYLINDIIKTNDNHYILCGNLGNWYAYYCKISGNGTLIWQIYFSINSSVFFNSVANTNDGGFIFAGTIHNNNDTGIIVKTNINGVYSWQKKYYMYNSNTVFTSITENNTSYFITGFTYPQYKNFVIKTDLSGDSNKTFVSVNDSDPHIIKANSNKFYISCLTGTNSSKIISIDSNLNIIKQLILTPSKKYLEIRNINIYKGDNTGDILLSGTTDITQVLSEELYAARIDSALNPPPGIGINLISSEIPKSFSLSQNYPNPFNPVTKIKFALPPSPKGKGLGVRLNVYDILGREIASLIPPQEGLKPGTYEVTFDASNYPSGAYFYKLITTEFTLSKKMILLK